MALPSNVQPSLAGQPLPFFSPYPIVGALGVNMFAQLPSYHGGAFSNPYVFPPIVLIPQVLRYLSGLGLNYTLVTPDIRPRRFWWPLLQRYPDVRAIEESFVHRHRLASPTIFVYLGISGFFVFCPLLDSRAVKQ